MLTGLALGSYAAVVLLARRGPTATRGYLRFTAICALAFGVLAWLSDGALPDAARRLAGRRRPRLGRAAPRSRSPLFTALVAVGLVVGHGRAARP